jgi:hypothetical protein
VGLAALAMRAAGSACESWLGAFAAELVPLQT